MLPATVQFIIAMIASALTDRLTKKMDYMRAEQRILVELLHQATGKKRFAFSEGQRRRLATKGKELTAKERKACCHFVRPETILAWYRQLPARKYDSSRTRNVGRPEYVAHYNAERYHQGMNGKLLTGDAAAANDNNATGVVKARSRLGRTLNFYHREAA